MQDDWSVSNKLSVNLGLRYEFNSNPTEVQGKESNIVNVLTDKSVEMGKLINSTPKRSVRARFGFAYKLGSDNKTVVRGGFGLFYDQIWGNVYGNVICCRRFIKQSKTFSRLSSIQPSPR